MLTQDFYGDSLPEVLAEITDWIIQHKPKNPVLIIIEQTRYIHFMILCDDYED